ncbi:putative RNA-directed DNA polymerase [Operophtera brumata]|uniref:Putative RNA-directed DNA polymerase n=1 Tax=Operophtera brumata TaxID=104452 RepID=A0A0L7K2G4_OPEBR|nr:putative RNA-directed DNA polymerase [Operophtera brumata]
MRLIQENKSNVKKTWQVIKNICNLEKNIRSPTELIQNSTQISDVHNHFANVGRNLAQNILERLKTNENVLLKVYKNDNTDPSNSLVLLPTDKGEIKNIVLCLRTLDQCNCYTLINSTHLKYLGVTIDQHLRWDEQIKTLSGRVRKLIYIFKGLRHIKDTQLLKSVYYCLGQSIVSYGILGWGGAGKTFILQLERAQRAIIKVLLSKPYLYPTNRLYNDFEVLTVRQLYIKTTTLTQHRLPCDPSRVNIRRCDVVYKTPKYRTKFSHKFFCFLGPFVYNKINKDLNLMSMSTFSCKQLLDDYLKLLDYDNTENLLAVSS